MNSRMGRDHLQFNADPTQMFKRARTASSAICDRSERLASPFRITLVEGIFQYAGESSPAKALPPYTGSRSRPSERPTSLTASIISKVGMP